MYSLSKSKAKNSKPTTSLKNYLFNQNALLRFIKFTLLIAAFSLVNSIPLLTFSTVLVDLELTINNGISLYAAFGVR